MNFNIRGRHYTRKLTSVMNYNNNRVVFFLHNEIHNTIETVELTEKETLAFLEAITDSALLNKIPE